MPENEEAWELWNAVATQWRAGGMGLVGLDYNAVEIVADKLDIEFDSIILKKLATIEREVLTAQGKASDIAVVTEYCLACAKAKKNTDCALCDLTTIKKKDVTE